LIEKLKNQLRTKRSLTSEAVTVVRDVFDNHVVSRFRPLDPTVLQVNVNARCNARCGMCNIWRTEDKTQLSLEEFERVFSDPAMDRIEYIILAGGEPTMRKDLPEIVDLMLQYMPNLRKIAVPTTGIATERTVRLVEAMARACAASDVVLSIGISLDGVGEVYEEVRGVPRAYNKVLKTIHALKTLQDEVDFNLAIGPTISALNVRDMENVRMLGKELDITTNYGVAAYSDSYFNNTELTDAMTFSREDKEYLKGFLAERMAEGPALNDLPYYYESMIAMLDGAERSMPCLFQSQGLVLDPNGDVHYCINSKAIGNVKETPISRIYSDIDNLTYRDSLRTDRCSTCEISCFIGVGLRKTLFPYLGFLWRQAVRKMKTAAMLFVPFIAHKMVQAVQDNPILEFILA